MPVTLSVAEWRREFDAEYFVARRDISPVMLLCAQGKLDAVAQYFREATEDTELFAENRDGNTLLSVAVANQHLGLTSLLLELQANIMHRNLSNLDALDLATMEGVRTPIAKLVLQHCDYVTPEILDGPYWGKCQRALEYLTEDGVTLARATVLGRTPDFTNPKAKEMEYTVDWLKKLHLMVNLVRKGLLLLSSELPYLERDAVMSGALEIPETKRFVFCVEDRKIVKFVHARNRPEIYGDGLPRRVNEACQTGDAVALRGLLMAHASPNVEDTFGQTALMRAALKGESMVVDCLLQAKAHVGAQNKDGYTALLLAAVGNHPTTVRLLLRARGDPAAQSHKGFSVLSFVKHEGHKEILALIKEEQERMKFAPRARSASRPRSIRPTWL